MAIPPMVAVSLALVKRFGIRLVEVFFSKEKIGSLRILKKSKKRDVLMFWYFFFPEHQRI